MVCSLSNGLMLWVVPLVCDQLDLNSWFFSPSLLDLPLLALNEQGSNFNMCLPLPFFHMWRMFVTCLGLQLALLRP